MNKAIILTGAAAILVSTGFPSYAKDETNNFLNEKNKGAKHFQKADMNKDGFLTKSEMLESCEKRMDKMFAELDADGDDKLSEEEFGEGHKELRKRMKEKLDSYRKESEEGKK